MKRGRGFAGMGDMSTMLNTLRSRARRVTGVGSLSGDIGIKGEEREGAGAGAGAAGVCVCVLGLGGSVDSTHTTKEHADDIMAWPTAVLAGQAMMSSACSFPKDRLFLSIANLTEVRGRRGGLAKQRHRLSNAKGNQGVWLNPKPVP